MMIYGSKMHYKWLNWKITDILPLSQPINTIDKLKCGLWIPNTEFGFVLPFNLQSLFYPSYTPTEPFFNEKINCDPNKGHNSQISPVSLISKSISSF